MQVQKRLFYTSTQAVSTISKKGRLTVAGSQRGWGSVYGHRWLWMSGPVRPVRPVRVIGL